MEETAERILEILQDYHCDFPATKYEMSVEHITKWANQFEDDAAFVLSELLHFLPQIYISKSKAIELLKQRLIDFQNLYKYQTMNEFIMNTHFIDVQKEEKSQKQILTLVKEIINNGFGINYDLTINEPKKHHIYFDDVLATGGTIYKDISIWLTENFQDVVENKKTFALSLFCFHQLGYGNMKWGLMQDEQLKKLFDTFEVSNNISEKVVQTKTNYIIENQAKWSNQRLNCAYPLQEQSKDVLVYLTNFSESSSKVQAFRTPNTPLIETFFTNSENRNKLEKIFTEKGLELLKKVNSDEVDFAKRPLGYTVRSHKTLGTGTLFFTWRNISNTCPLVFWWYVPSHNWTPLFCLKNTGI